MASRSPRGQWVNEQFGDCYSWTSLYPCCPQVRWSDPHGLFHKYSSSLRSFHVECGNKPAIQPLYHDLQDWFLKSARVPPKPSLGDYGELLVHVADTRTMALGLLDVLAILSMLGGELLDAWQKSKVMELWPGLLYRSWFVTGVILHVTVLAEDCNNSIGNALEFLQSFAKPLT